MTQEELLATGIAEMGLDISASVQQRLLNYLSLLQKWNKVYNLTAVRDPSEMVTLHLLDSLSVLPHIKAKNLLDVGSGAGLPGVVLAICLPQLKVTTIDAVQKKTIFMRHVKGELNLGNLEVVHARVENFQSAEKFGVIISRAFSEIALLVKFTQHLIAKNGQWLAMKGVVPCRELENLDIQESLILKGNKIIPLKVAGLKAERHLVVLENH